MISTLAPVTVLIPVYRGLDDVRRCVDSVLRHAKAGRTPVELLLIDDASPEPDVSRHLDGVAADEGSAISVEVLRNPANLGFVGTVNRGLRHSSGDVVILNSDTVVTAGWLDRLAAAARAEDVATVTPLSNFASICTLPASIIDAFDLDGDRPRIDECARFVSAHTLSLRPEVITGTGFCMYVTRRSIDRCGLLDEETFGRGYGEEVDFCLRAGRLGFRHVVEDATFVYHRGGGSFGIEGRAEGLARGSAILHARYPFFRAANRRERREDPLAVSFAALELGLTERDPERPHVLHVLHSSPEALGGTEKHMLSLIDALLPEFDASILYPVSSGFVVRTIHDVGTDRPIEREHLLPGGSHQVKGIHDEVAGEALMMALDLFDVDAVHVQNLINHSLAPLEVLRNFSGPVVCSVRDLYLACPHHWLLYRNQQACGIPEDLDLCARCLPETRNLDRSYLETFRRMVTDRVDIVDHWVFASRSAADYLLRAYDIPEERIELIEHGAIIGLAGRRSEIDEDAIFDEPLRLAFVGLGWPKKGIDIVNEMAERFAGTNVELHHFGKLRWRASSFLHVNGPYDNEMLPELLHQAGVQVVLLPAPYAETFGHVMTEALIAGLPVIGTSYGALGERIRTHQVGWTVDPEDPDALEQLITDLDHCRSEVLRATRAARRAPILSVGGTSERYARLYRRSATTVEGTRSTQG